MTPAKRKRIGCGCLGCLVPLFGFVALGVVVIFLIRALLTPWAFFLGGTFHPLPAWTGKGTFHTRAGEFTLILDLEPATPSRLGYPRASGWATLFTPRGERIPMRVTADLLEKAVGFEPDGQKMDLELHRRTLWSGFANTDDRPRLLLRGMWRGRDLETSDGGSIARAFLPDGRVDLTGNRPAPLASETRRVVLHTGSWPEYLRVVFGDEPDTPAR